MTSKRTAPSSREALTVCTPEHQEPNRPANLKRFAGSDSRAFNNVLLNATLAALCCPEGSPRHAKDDRLAAAIQALGAFHPADEIEGMIAAQAVAMHQGAMECFRRAMIPNQPFEVASRLRKDGASLARGMVEMVAALDRKRGRGGKQVVRVEHVTIEAGGQAIVGALTAGTRGEG